MRNFIILAIVLYVLYKVGSFLFRAGAISQQLKQEKERQQRRTSSRDGKVKGGDYVDYEDVR